MAVSTVTEVRTLPVIVEVAECIQEEFENSEFYIEESLPSSLEWGRDGRQVYFYTLRSICKTVANITLMKLYKKPCRCYNNCEERPSI